MKINWREIGILGFIGYVLSLPILIWRSSHIGKALSVAVMLVVIFWGAGKVSDIYFAKYRYRILIDERAKPITAAIENLEGRVRKTENRIDHLDSELDNRVNSSVVEVARIVAVSLNDVDKKLEEINNASDIIKESERQAVKDRIIEMKEQVKVYKKSIDSSEIRKRCESVSDKLYLLKDDEKERFKKDLKEIGFDLSSEREGVVTLYSNSWSIPMATGSTIQSYPMAVSGDSVTVSYDGSEYRRRNRWQ